VAQLNLYVPDELSADLKERARRAGMPHSRYVIRLLTPVEQKGWPARFFEETCGFLAEDFAEPEDALPEPVFGIE